MTLQSLIDAAKQLKQQAPKAVIANLVVHPSELKKAIRLAAEFNTNHELRLFTITRDSMKRGIWKLKCKGSEVVWGGA